MAKHVLTNCKLWLAGFDLSGDMNALALEGSVTVQDTATFGNTYMARAAGLKQVRASHQGFWEAGTDLVDDVLFSNFGLADVPMSVGPLTGADGERGYTFEALTGEYNFGAGLDDAMAFSVTAEASDGAGLIGSTIMHNAVRTASGNGTARQLGATAAGQSLYAALHVIAASGTTPTLDVTVESDDAMGFPSATTQITFAQKTAIGSEWAIPIAGPITDDWLRVSYSIGGTGPSFTFIVLIGIQ